MMRAWRWLRGVCVCARVCACTRVHMCSCAGVEAWQDWLHNSWDSVKKWKFETPYLKIIKNLKTAKGQSNHGALGAQGSVHSCTPTPEARPGLGVEWRGAEKEAKEGSQDPAPFFLPFLISALRSYCHKATSSWVFHILWVEENVHKP